MALAQGAGPVLAALEKIHEDENIFSYGISDSPGGIDLYTRGKKIGVLVTGKPGHTLLPPPFDQVPQVGGLGHQVHHKFVVCGFNGDNPVVYCGSSNLALGGEQDNGDNLIAIHDGDVATVFAIEALALVDHFDFLDRSAQEAKSAGKAVPTVSASKQQLAKSAGWFLSTTDQWAAPYFDPNDLHFVDRELFGATA
jgi:phosphatidylserine/phosphatidylglycerophosphate/cardiolipin synthase-like enzyme